MNRMQFFNFVYITKISKYCEKPRGASSLNGIYFNKTKFLKLLPCCKYVNLLQCYFHKDHPHFCEGMSMIITISYISYNPSRACCPRTDLVDWPPAIASIRQFFLYNFIVSIFLDPGTSAIKYYIRPVCLSFLPLTY